MAADQHFDDEHPVSMKHVTSSAKAAIEVHTHEHLSANCLAQTHPRERSCGRGIVASLVAPAVLFVSEVLHLLCVPVTIWRCTHSPRTSCTSNSLRVVRAGSPHGQRLLERANRDSRSCIGYLCPARLRRNEHQTDNEQLVRDSQNGVATAFSCTGYAFLTLLYLSISPRTPRRWRDFHDCTPKRGRGDFSALRSHSCVFVCARYGGVQNPPRCMRRDGGSTRRPQE
ncbi:hypothetical protein K523DRAFT_119833 [Schizophyllum commune Tattone D]|nr:hypothetical protein K523DRAFT_119833 [Schizophyllum commune Tattone D]